MIDGFEQNEILATLNGKPAVLLQVKSTDDMQVVKASQAVKRWIEKTQPTLPVGVDLELWSDNAEVFENRMELIAESSILGLFLVFVVLILTLEPEGGAVGYRRNWGKFLGRVCTVASQRRVAESAVDFRVFAGVRHCRRRRHRGGGVDSPSRTSARAQWRRGGG